METGSYVRERDVPWTEKLFQSNLFILKNSYLVAGVHLIFPPAPEAKVPDLTAQPYRGRVWPGSRASDARVGM